MPTTDTATPTLLDPTASVSTLLDGDTVSRDNLFKEATPGATPKLTLALLLDYLAGVVMPTVSNRGALAANETLTLGHREYLYLEPSAANRIVYLPTGSYSRQRIKVRSIARNPTYKLEFQHAASTTVPITFSAASTTQMPWAVLEWDTSGIYGSNRWIVVTHGGGAALP